MSTFSDALTALLQERDITQAGLARRLGLTPQAVSAWVTGSTTPSRDNVEALEDELAVEPRGWLLNLAGYSSDTEPGSPTVESLIRVDPGLDPEDKRVLLRIIAMARERFAALVRWWPGPGLFAQRPGHTILRQWRAARMPGLMRDLMLAAVVCVAVFAVAFTVVVGAILYGV